MASHLSYTYRYSSSPATLTRCRPVASPKNGFLTTQRRDSCIPRLGFRSISAKIFVEQEKRSTISFKECALSIALAIGLVIGTPTLDRAAYAYAPAGPTLPDLSVLISGPPIKDPGALLRYALPINNKAIREVQKPLEDITESLKIAGVKALDSVERNVRQASRTLNQGKDLILSGVAESKKEYGKELLDKLAVGLGELQKIVEERKREAVAPKQKELLQYVSSVEEAMVDGFPYEVPEEYRSMPLLKGRATVDMKMVSAEDTGRQILTYEERSNKSHSRQCGDL